MRQGRKRQRLAEATEDAALMSSTLTGRYRNAFAQKKYFRGPHCFVELGCSSTNCHSYKVLVSGTRLVICSNGWSEAAEKMDRESDRQWFADNSYVLNIGATPMYS